MMLASLEVKEKGGELISKFTTFLPMVDDGNKRG